MTPKLALWSFGLAVLADAPPSNLPSWEKAGLVGGMGVAIVAFMKGWIVPGPSYSDMREQNARVRSENERLIAELADTKALLKVAQQTAERLAQKMQPPGA